MTTQELINLKSVTDIYYSYRENWSYRGLNEFAKTIYCEDGEDGIIEKIFSIIGEESKYYVEFGAWDGCHLSNTYSLRKDKNWKGLLLDGKFDIPEINLHKHYLTAENIVELFLKYNVPQKFDLLSVDIDGNDFYLLKSILGSFKPRVIVVETNQLISPLIAATIEYNPNIYFDVNARYYGASTKAFDNLTKLHGYQLVCQHDQNAFFVLNEDAEKLTIHFSFIGNVEKIFKPRIPRHWADSTGKHFLFTKACIEELSVNNTYPNGLEPLIEYSMKNLDLGGDWVMDPK